LISSQH